MNALRHTHPKVLAGRRLIEDLDAVYGCVEWYRYPQAAADSLRPTSLENRGPARIRAGTSRGPENVQDLSAHAGSDV